MIKKKLDESIYNKSHLREKDSSHDFVNDVIGKRYI